MPELNTGFGAAGNWGGSIGASLSTVYFGVDSFYPGGWPQLFDDGNMVQGKLDEGFNQAALIELMFLELMNPNKN